MYITYIGRMENKMETTRDYKDHIGIILGLYRENGKENGNGPDAYKFVPTWRLRAIAMQFASIKGSKTITRSSLELRMKIMM